MAPSFSMSQFEQEIQALKDENSRCKMAEQALLQSVRELNEQFLAEQALRRRLEQENEKLANLSNTDSLTRLFNHRYMMERCQDMFRQSKRYGAPLSCVMVDIDHFKAVNDTYGHQFGDVIIKGLARLLKEKTRAADLCGRYGGEEFIILMTLPVKQAMEYVLRLHKIIGEETFSDENYSLRITASIGFAEYRSEMNSCRELVERADQALYRAKQGGRNLVRAWVEETDEVSDIIDNFSIDELKAKFGDLYHQIKASYVESTNALLNAIDAKDHYTLRHSQNVARYASNLAVFMGLKNTDVEIIKNAGLLHDIGKIGIESKVLIKKEALTGDEFEIMKKHSVIGVNILKDISLLSKELPIILHHHERVDGTGYPHGLRSNEIPLGSKILAVVDSYDAMRTNREFQDKMSRRDAMEVLRKGRGSQFDEVVVDKFVELLEQNPEDEFPVLFSQQQDISWEGRRLI